MARTTSADVMRSPNSGWTRIWLRRGVPVQYKEQLIYANPVFMCEIPGDEIERAKNDPEVAKGDDEALSSKILVSCLAGVADQTYTAEEAAKNVRASRELDAARRAFVPTEDEPVFSKSAKDALVGEVAFPGDQTVLRFLIKDINRPEILPADKTRLLKAFQTLNMLIDEDIDTFFDLPDLQIGTN